MCVFLWRMRTLAPERIAPSRTLLVLLVLLSVPAVRAQSTSPPDSNSVPIIDGEIGPCSADFTVIDNAGAPIYAATIQVDIAYGFLNAYKLDLQLGTNASGKARFTGLPAKSKHGLFFWAAKDKRVEVIIQFKDASIPVRTYYFELHPRDLDHTQFEWTFPRQLYDALHDYFVEMFLRTPQDRADRRAKEL